MKHKIAHVLFIKNVLILKKPEYVPDIQETWPSSIANCDLIPGSCILQQGPSCR